MLIIIYNFAKILEKRFLQTFGKFSLSFINPDLFYPATKKTWQKVLLLNTCIDLLVTLFLFSKDFFHSLNHNLLLYFLVQLMKFDGFDIV
jgi:hypothetical protein